MCSPFVSRHSCGGRWIAAGASVDMIDVVVAVVVGDVVGIRDLGFI